MADVRISAQHARLDAIALHLRRLPELQGEVRREGAVVRRWNRREWIEEVEVADDARQRCAGRITAVPAYRQDVPTW
jgi:hypothetical protein